LPVIVYTFFAGVLWFLSWNNPSHWTSACRRHRQLGLWWFRRRPSTKM